MQIYRRGNNWWYAFTVDGRRIRRSAKTPDRRLAEDIAAKDEWRHRHAAVHGKASVLTFGEALRIYLQSARDNRFLRPLLDRWEHVRVADITPEAIRHAARAIYPNCSPATWNRQVITPARAVINAAAEAGHCAPIRVRRFPEKKTERRAGYRDWINRFSVNAPAELAALARFMFETGTRIGDAVSLTWNDVDLGGATATFATTKNGESHCAHLSPGMVADIANLPRNGRHIRKVFGYASRHTVYRQWRATIERAGIEPLTPHEAGRHGFATELIIRNGVDIPTAAKMGNWRTHRLLSETYVHPEREREIVAKVFGNKR